MADKATLYPCEHPTCDKKDVAEKMWNFRGYPRVIVCGKHGLEARGKGIQTFRLSESFALEQKKAEERKASEGFYARHRVEHRQRRNPSGGTLGDAVGQKVVDAMRKVAR